MGGNSKFFFGRGESSKFFFIRSLFHLFFSRSPFWVIFMAIILYQIMNGLGWILLWKSPAIYINTGQKDICCRSWALDNSSFQNCYPNFISLINLYNFPEDKADSGYYFVITNKQKSENDVSLLWWYNK